MLRTAVRHLRRSSHHLRQSLHDGRERLQGSVARLQEITSTATAYGSLLGSGILGGALGGLVGLGAHGGAITFPALIMVNYSQAVAAGTSGVVVAAIGISGTFGALFLVSAYDASILLTPLLLIWQRSAPAAKLTSSPRR